MASIKHPSIFINLVLQQNVWTTYITLIYGNVLLPISILHLKNICFDLYFRPQCLGFWTTMIVTGI